MANPKTEGNETYIITVASPLLRPGMTISTEVSARYVVPTATRLFEKAREIKRAQDLLHAETDRPT